MGMIEWGPSYSEQPDWQGEVDGGIWDYEWARMGTNGLDGRGGRGGRGGRDGRERVVGEGRPER